MLGDAIATPIPTGDDIITPFDLLPDVISEGAQLTVTLACNTRRFTAEKFGRSCDRYAEILRAIASR